MGLFPFRKNREKEKKVMLATGRKSESFDEDRAVFTPEDRERVGEVVEFRLGISGTAAGEKVFLGKCSGEEITLRCRYETERFKDGACVTEVEPIHDKDGDKACWNKVQALLLFCGVRNWDGFVGHNPPDVLDGGSMSFEALLSDGRRIRACGTNNYPDRFYELERGLAELFQKCLVEQTSFSCRGLCLTLPESWVGRVKVRYGEGSVTFYVEENQKDIYLFRLDISSHGYNGQENSIRLGRLTEGEKTWFSDLYPYSEMESHFLSYQKEAIYTDEERQILQEVFKGTVREEIAGSAKGAGTVSFIPEDGSILYYDDARRLFERAKSCYDSLFFGGEFPGGCRLIEKEGKAFISFSPSYERKPVRTLADLTRRMEELFSKQLVEKLLRKKEEKGQILCEEGLLYVDCSVPENEKAYGQWKLNEPENTGEGRWQLPVTVKKAAEADAAYVYSLTETYVYQIIKEEDRFVVDVFPCWKTPVWKEKP